MLDSLSMRSRMAMVAMLALVLLAGALALGGVLIVGEIPEMGAVQRRYLSLIILEAGAAGGVAFLVVAMVGRLTRQLSYVERALARLAGGETEVEPPPFPYDEASRGVQRALESFAGSLRELRETRRVQASRNADLQVALDQVRKLTRAIDQNPAAIFVTDLGGTIEYVNPAFTRLTGFTAGEAIGQTPRILKSGEMPSEYYAEMWSTILAGEEWRGEIRDRRKDGGLFWVAASIAPVRDETGSVSHFVAMHEDITERRTAELAVRAAKEQAELASRSKTEFLANMSHELRTPLNAIIGFSEMVQMETLGPLGVPQYREYLNDINASGRHLLELINDVLDVSAIEAGRLELREEAVDLGRILDSTLRMVTPRADLGKVALEKDIRGNLPLLRGDPRRIKQILLNLLTNAVKFTPEGGRVGISVSGAGGDLEVSVSDSGIGMTDDEIAKAMRPFAQVDSGLDRRKEGTGLGLPLVEGLVRLHGGRMEISSSKHAGTRVTVSFPAPRVISGVLAN